MSMFHLLSIIGSGGGGGEPPDTRTRLISIYGQSLSLGITPTAVSDLVSVEASKAITAATSANPVVVVAGNDFVNGDNVFIKGVGGTTQINRRSYTVAAATPLQFALKHHDGTDVDGSAFGVYTTGGTVARCLIASNVKMFQVGIRPNYDDRTILDANVDSYNNQQRCLSSLIGLRERVSPINVSAGETFGYGISRTFTGDAILAATGRAAYSAAELSMDNTLGIRHFSNTYVAAKEAYELSAALLDELSSTALMVYKQGEADGAIATTKAAWKTLVQAIRSDFERGFKMAMLDTITLKMVVDQQAFYQSGGTTYHDIAVAAIELHRAGGGFYCAGPNYWCSFVDTLHFTQAMYRHYGEHLGRVLKSLADTGAWRPCYITNAIRSGATITVTVHVPEPPLVLDTTLVASITNSGFTYSGATITGVSITDTGAGDSTATVEITLNASAGGNLGYAYANGTSGNVGPTLGSRGNLRDSSTLISTLDGTTHLYNWLCNDQWVVA